MVTMDGGTCNRGGVTSLTTTLNVHTLLAPPREATQVTRFVPAANWLCGGGVQSTG